MEIAIVLAAAAAILLLLRLATRLLRPAAKKRPGRAAAGKPGRTGGRWIPGSTVAGKAWVVDGDGIRVSGYNVRLPGLDAPEWDQPAKHANGHWFNHGKRVKSALIQAVGGKHVRVALEGYDKHGRALGTVTHDGRDIGEWLVANGLAIAAYGDRYEKAEREAREARRGMWGYAVAFDPRDWRNREAKNSWRDLSSARRRSNGRQPDPPPLRADSARVDPRGGA